MTAAIMPFVPALLCLLGLAALFVWLAVASRRQQRIRAKAEKLVDLKWAPIYKLATEEERQIDAVVERFGGKYAAFKTLSANYEKLDRELRDVKDMSGKESKEKWRFYDLSEKRFGFLVSANRQRKYFQRLYKAAKQRCAELESKLADGNQVLDVDGLQKKLVAAEQQLQFVTARYESLVDAVINREPIEIQMPGRFATRALKS